MEDVVGVLFLSFTGELVFHEFSNPRSPNFGHKNWRQFVRTLDGIHETDLIFDRGRIYIRRTDIGYLCILLRKTGPIAMLRLNCDILMPALKPSKAPGKLSRLFKK
jgi:hypothetical protein